MQTGQTLHRCSSALKADEEQQTGEAPAETASSEALRLHVDPEQAAWSHSQTLMSFPWSPAAVGATPAKSEDGSTDREGLSSVDQAPHILHKVNKKRCL